MDIKYKGFPPQQLPMSKKTKEWRKAHLDWAESMSFYNFAPVRTSVKHKKINYDLMNGRLHMSDLKELLMPIDLGDYSTPERIQHYPLVNLKVELLRGEESRRLFEYRAVITNPNAISEKEREKQRLVLEQLQADIQQGSLSEEEYQDKLKKSSDYFTFEWQDMRELRANEILNHYSKEYNFPLMFQEGYEDALISAEEIYQCDIVGGEPVMYKVNPIKISIFRSGFSNRIEDADVIVLEDYWSPSRVIDTYYDVLSKEDIKYLEGLQNGGGTEEGFGNMRDERMDFIPPRLIRESVDEGGEFDFRKFTEGFDDGLNPFDIDGNVRVLRVYWKSRRRIKKVKRYNPMTGEEEFDFYPENYVIDKTKGEEETYYYINQAWEGTKIGEKIYVNMRPRPIQYNRLDNPSRCHFGIVGSIYNLNDGKPFSFVDRIKPYNYLYDIVHDKLNKTISRDWGNSLKIEMSKIPAKMSLDQFLFYAKNHNIIFEDSFNEGNRGAATNKLAGMMNNAGAQIMASPHGQSIQQYISLLEYIKNSLDISGVSRQREGQISNRETVGGVERATVQSSMITEWLFAQHDDVKKRALECFLETAKIAMRGKQKKFQHVLSDGSLHIIDIDGDEFAEADYGIVVNNDNGVQALNQKLDTLAQAALQTQTLKFSSIMKLYTSISLAEKQRMIEKAEAEMMEQQQQQQQQQMEMQRQQMEQQSRLHEEDMKLKVDLNTADNQTRILVAQINADAMQANTAMARQMTEGSLATLEEKRREFDEGQALKREKLDVDRSKIAASERKANGRKEK